MQQKNRSISQRLKKCSNPVLRQEILNNWIKNWETEQSELISKLGQAIKHDNFDETCIVCGQLKAVSEKKFAALKNIIENILLMDKTQ